MCLGIPGKIVSINGDHALIDYGGVVRDANISLVDAREGDYVIIHAGFAIETLTREEAEKTIKLWKELLLEENMK